MTPAKSSTPIPGYWYSTPDGKLIRCRAILLAGAQRRVHIENITGGRRSLSPGDWDSAGFILHSPVHDRRAV